MKLTIDRFEGKYAVCEKEDLTMIDINIDLLPPGAKEGDILIIDGDNIKIDEKKTKDRRKEMEKLLNDLWE